MTEGGAQPLALDSPQWLSLHHIYGDASDTPRHLLELYEGMAADLAEGPLKKLVDSLYHQGDPDTAAYAALPHLVALANTRSGEERVALLLLVGWLEGARSDKRPPIPEAFRNAYFSALKTARGLLVEHLGTHTGNAVEFRYLLGALASCSGHRVLADVMFNLDAIYDGCLEHTGEGPLSAPKI